MVTAVNSMKKVQEFSEYYMLSQMQSIFTKKNEVYYIYVVIDDNFTSFA